MTTKKIFALVGIILTLVHMTYFAFRPYSFLYFMLGFGVLYVIFVLGIRKMKTYVQ